MKIAIFYFSGTGNTRWVCERFSEAMSRKSVQTDIIAIDHRFEETLKSIDLEKYDRIGISHPIYGGDIPPIVRRFILNLEQKLSHPKDGFILATFGYVNALGYFAEKKYFHKLTIRQYINIRMPNNITSPRLKSKLPDEQEVQGMKRQAIKTIEKMVVRVVANKKVVTGIAPYLIAGIIIRKNFSHQIRDYYQSISVDMNRCARCFDCVNHCPAKAITFNADRLEFSDKCTACMRCYNFCPKYAVLIEGKYADPAEYTRYRCKPQ